MSEEATVATMKKDDLAAYALAEHGVELDLTKPVKELREYVAGLDERKAGKEAPAVEEVKRVKSNYLRHPVNNRVYPTTPVLAARGDMLPCKKDGTLL